MRILLALALLEPAFAHDVITTKITFAQEISRLFAKRCLSCHREGGPAPMALDTYEEARPWAKAIKEEVLERRMPPWGAVKGFGSFANDHGLTQEEINLIAEWVEGGAPEGDPKYLPANPAVKAEELPKPSGRRWRVSGHAAVTAPATLLALEPAPSKPVKSLRVFADLPDGRIQPLLWLRDYHPEWRRTFILRKPLALAPGARIRIEPEEQIPIVLLLKK